MWFFVIFVFCMELAYMLGKGHDTIVLGDYRMNQLLEMLETNPIVAAIKDEAGLEAALKSEVGIVFVLHGDLCTLPAIVERIKLKKRMAIVHVDLIEGLSNDEVALDYIKMWFMRMESLRLKVVLFNMERRLVYIRFIAILS